MKFRNLFVASIFIFQVNLIVSLPEISSQAKALLSVYTKICNRLEELAIKQDITTSQKLAKANGFIGICLKAPQKYHFTLSTLSCLIKHGRAEYIFLENADLSHATEQLECLYKQIVENK